MNLDDMTPVGGGDLRGPAAPSISRAAGTFTPTQIVDPDAVWNPRSREVGQEDTGPRYDAYWRAESERPVQRDYAGQGGPLSFADVATAARAAVRP